MGKFTLMAPEKTEKVVRNKYLVLENVLTLALVGFAIWLVFSGNIWYLIRGFH